MTENNTQTQYQATTPNPALKNLDNLVGTWDVQGRENGPYGEIHGQVIYEWMEGGFFLIQHVDIYHIDHHNQGIEIIGYERSWDGTASPDCTSHFFGSTGESFGYVYDMEGDTLTIWGGERGSPAYFKGTFTPDHRTMTGRWVWPGGGYESTMTRVR